MDIKLDQPLFSLKQGRRNITFGSPISGNVIDINMDLEENVDSLELSPYHENWICKIDANNLDMEIKDLQIGNSAVDFYQKDIENYQNEINNLGINENKSDEYLFKGELKDLDDFNFKKIVSKFFLR